MKDVEETSSDKKWDMVFGMLAEAHPTLIAVVEPESSETIPPPAERDIAISSPIDISYGGGITRLAIGGIFVSIPAIFPIILQNAPNDSFLTLLVPAMFFLYGLGLIGCGLIKLKSAFEAHHCHSSLSRQEHGRDSR